MRCSRQPHRLGLLGRLGTAVLVWFVAFAMLLAVAPRGAAQAPPHLAPSSVGSSARMSAGSSLGSSSAGVWAWPLAPQPQVTRTFEPPASRFGPGHRGVDLAATSGQRVLAVADGIVSHSGVIAGRGTVSVLHASGIRSTYEPVDDRVPEGTAVAAGAEIGTVGTGSHCGDGGACLHLGARLGEDYLDPLLLLTRVRIVLLPLLEEG